MINVEFKKEDENYIYNVIGKNVKKYRKLRKLTQAQLAEKMGYSLSFVASIESKKYQTFSLGALYRISLVLDIDMYKLCIDEDDIKEQPKVVKYKCNKCDYTTEIPFEIITLLKSASKICTKIENCSPVFNCSNCDGIIVPEKNNN